MEPGTKRIITGPLQERILMLLSNKPLCGKDMMGELGLRSPGTIYPVLEDLRAKELIDYRVDASGSVRKKTYELTAKGRTYVRETFQSSVKMFCCDASLYTDTILSDLREIIQVRRRQKVLCTVEYEGVKRYLDGADVTYASDVEGMTDQYDMVLSFPGFGCMIGREPIVLAPYLQALYERLKSGGTMLVVDIERTDNLFVKIFFEDIRKMKKAPGVNAKEMEQVLRSIGFRSLTVHPRSGMLYAVAKKD